MGKVKSVARAVAAWIAVVLSLYAVFVIFNTLFLVPDDSIVSGPSPQLIRLKAEIITVSVAVLIVLIFFARWAFRKANGYRNSN
jgi:ammonia channel protein AmtB